MEVTRKTQDRNYWRQLIASDPAMDGEHNGVVRIGLDVEATRKAQDRNYWRQPIASDPANPSIKNTQLINPRNWNW